MADWLPQRDAYDANADGWFVVWTESRAEKKVAFRFEATGIECWLPRVTERRRWSDRWRDVVIPLFPNYIFARNQPAYLARLLRTPGVLTVVKHGGRPAILAADFVKSLRRAIEITGVPAVPVVEPSFQAGDEVIVQEGPLMGLRGVVRETRGGRKLLIWVAEVGRGVAFTIGTASVHPAAPL